MDFSKLKPSDWLVGGGSVVFLISMFLPWFNVDFQGFGGDTEAANGWDYGFFGIIPLLLLIAVTVVLVVPKFAQLSIPDPIGPLPKLQAALIAAAVAAVIVILRLILGFEEDVPEGIGFEVNRGLGLFLATLAAIAVAVGTFMKQSESDSTASSGGPATPF